MEAKKQLTPKSKNISQFYLDVMELAQLADYSPVKGCMVIMPYGYAIWENVQKIFDAMIKPNGVQNAYFPIFIPYKLLEKEKEHVKGFSPELAIVTIGGGEKLEEPLVVRPTSETIMYQMYSQWIHSYKDLPLKINQWNNVVRWEKRTYPFLRTTEFLWQEGHTVHATEKESEEMALQALEWYKTLYEKYYAIAPIVGVKSRTETFAGAVKTYSTELILPDAKALQGATSHMLGQNFAKAYNIQYVDDKNTQQYPYQNSWGLSTRSLGGLFLTHSDDQGLILPPQIAPYQVVILPIRDSEKVATYVDKLKKELKDSSISFIVDTNYDKTLGWRRNYWEVKGAPLRLEVGEQEVDKNEILTVRRDTLTKETITNYDVAKTVHELLKSIQNDLYARSKELHEKLIVEIFNYTEFKQIMKEDRKFIKAFWCEDPTCEAKIKEETKATTRVLTFDEMKQTHDGKCIYCNKKAIHKWLFAQAY